jgi:hypothetical protein
VRRWLLASLLGLLVFAGVVAIGARRGVVPIDAPRAARSTGRA